MTRYERIMKMTVEELAEWLSSGDLHADCCACIYGSADNDEERDCHMIDCPEGRRLWLEEEFDEDGYGDDELPPLRDDEDED